MKCPHCANLTNKVIDSRLSKEGDVIRRRRVCLECGRRFTTKERVEEDLPMVIKKDGKPQDYDRQKIFNSIKLACKKRPINVEQIEKMTNRVERRIMELGEKAVHSSFIGNEIMKELYKVDHVAYVRFASVYREFKDVNEFMNELKNLISKNNKITSNLIQKSQMVDEGAHRGEQKKVSKKREEKGI